VQDFCKKNSIFKILISLLRRAIDVMDVLASRPRLMETQVTKVQQLFKTWRSQRTRVATSPTWCLNPIYNEQRYNVFITLTFTRDCNEIIWWKHKTFV